MPYYVGAGDPEWDEYLERSETDWSDEPPQSLFKYVAPEKAETSVLRFPEAPGAEPEAPQDSVYRQPSSPGRGFFARLFGKQAEIPTLSTEQLLERYAKMEKAISAHALWK